MMERVRPGRQEDRHKLSHSSRQKYEDQYENRRPSDHRKTNDRYYADQEDDARSDVYQNDLRGDLADRYNTQNHSASSRTKPSRLSVNSRHRDEYMNAPGNENLNPYDHFEEEYDDGEHGLEDYYGQQSVLSQQSSDVAASFSQDHHSESAPRRYRSRGENSHPAPSVDSMSNFGHRSLTGSMPNALGGNEQEFWTPDIEPSSASVQPQPTQPEPATRGGFRKFLDSFRRVKKPKNEVKTALSEQNLSTAKSSVAARVIMLDGEEISFHVDTNDVGQSLLARVCHAIDLVEMDYFGLTYRSNKIQTWFWLDLDKKITKQLRHGENWLFSFQVKFYPPEPTLLQEDITRYQLALQVRQDIYKGKLPCSWVTQALLGSFLVQSELGDYVEVEHGVSTEYLNEFEFVPTPMPQLLQKIAELHKTHKGMKPDQADIKYLETAKRLELYGMDLHPARDMENVEIYLGVGFHGLVIYRDRLKIGRFAWPKILRISYKKNNFFLKIRPDHSEPVETIIGFRLLNHNLAERLWKVAVEHHSFFRLKEARTPKGAHFPLNSSHIFSGHTFFEYRTMNIHRPHPQFERSLTKRRTASMPMGLDKSPSIHTLNRTHPRDMTIGRAQDTELDSQHSATAQASTRRSSKNVPSGHPSSIRTPQSELSQRFRDADQHSLSYASDRGSRMTDSQNRQYINRNFQPRFIPDNGSVLSGASMASEYSEQRNQKGAKGRRSYERDQQPNSPVYTNVFDNKSSAHDREWVDERTASGRRPPAGSVPMFGGVVNEQALAQQRRRVSERFETSTPRSSYPTENPNEFYHEEPDELEYDDDRVEDGTDDYQNGPDHRFSQSSRNRMNSSNHASRKRTEQTELML